MDVNDENDEICFSIQRSEANSAMSLCDPRTTIVVTSRFEVDMICACKEGMRRLNFRECASPDRAVYYREKHFMRFYHAMLVIATLPLLPILIHGVVILCNAKD